MTKITIWGIAHKRTECYGHGEYLEELSIQQENTYGPKKAFFHPFFLYKERAEAYCSLMKLGTGACVVPLELEIDSVVTDTAAAMSAQHEFARSGGWMG
jgi:hypothetical protein